MTNFFTQVDVDHMTTLKYLFNFKASTTGFPVIEAEGYTPDKLRKHETMSNE